MTTSDKTNPAGFSKLAEEYAGELKDGHGMVVTVTANSIVFVDIPGAAVVNYFLRALAPTEASLLFTRICQRIEDEA